MQSFDVHKQNTWSVMGCAVSINLYNARQLRVDIH